MGALSTKRQCHRLATTILAGLLMALAPSSGADVYNYEGLVVESSFAFTALGVVAGSGLTGTITMTPPPGGGTTTDTSILTESLLLMTRASDGATLFCFPYGPATVCPGGAEVPVTAIDALNITFAANGCPASGTIDLQAFSPSLNQNVPITLDLGARNFVAGNDLLGFVTGTGGLTCVAGSPEIDPFPNPATVIDFGSVTTADSNQTQNITITNSGAAALNVGTVTLTGASDFSKTADTCSNTAVANSGGTCGITVTFDPTTVSMTPLTATLTIPSDDADENPVIYNFQATVSAPPGTIGIAGPTIADTVSGMANTGTVTVSNTGAGPLTITSVNTNPANMLDPPFSIIMNDCPVSPMTLSNTPPMNTCQITVQFDAPATGITARTEFMDSFDIASNDPMTPVKNVPVSAFALPPAVPVLTVSDNPLNLPSAAVTASSTAVLNITNMGAADLIITGFSGLAAPFSVMRETCTTAGGGGPIAPMTGSCTVTVEFTPASTGPFTDMLVIASNDTVTSPNVTVNGTGTMAPVPDISVATSTDPTGAELNLGMLTVSVDPASTGTVTVTNNGAANLNVSSVMTSSGDFSVVGSPCTAAVPPAPGPGNTCTITVSFLPTAVGTRTGMLTIVSDDPDTAMVTVSLTGEGLMAPEPNISIATDTDMSGMALDLGSALFGASATPKNITVTNSGNANLTFGTISKTGTDAAAFDLGLGGTGQCMSGMTLAQMTSCTIAVTFTASAPAVTKTAMVVIPSNDPDTASAMVTLNAMAVQPVPNIMVDMAMVSFGVVDAGTAATPRMITVRNTGDAPLNVGPISLATGTVFGQTNTGCTTVMPTGMGPPCVITVTFTPTAMVNATYTDTLTIASDDPDMATVTVGLSGQGSTVPLPDISSDEMSLNLGMVFMTQSSMPQTVTITNNGTADLTIFSILRGGTDAASFTVTSGCPIAPAVLARGASCMASVTMSPMRVGPLSAFLRFHSDDPDTMFFDIGLNGMGLMPLPDISVPMSLSFGPVTRGMSSTMMVTVTNNGLGNLNVMSATTTPGSDYSVVGSPCMAPVPPPGGANTCDITVQFTPTDVGTRTGILTITSDDPDTPMATVTLTGEGQAPKISIATDTDITGAALDLGSALLTQSAMPRNITITNTGGANLTFGTISKTGVDAAAFALGFGGSCGSGMTLAPTGSCTIAVTFTANAPAGAKTAIVVIPSNDPDTPSKSVTLSGTAAAPTPVAEFTDTALTLPTVEQGMTSTGFIEVTNRGAGDLVVSAIATSNAIAAPYALTSETCTAMPIPNGGSCRLNFSFAPTAVGSFSETFNFDSNDGTPSRVLSLQGTATMMPAPEITVRPVLANFASVVVGNTSDSIITVRNDGMANLTIGTVVIGGTGSGEYRPPVSTCGTVTPGNSCTVTVTFAPTNAGVATATLTIPSNDADESTVDVALIGTATPAPMPIISTPVSADVGNVLVGRTGTATFNVTNTGTANLAISSVTPAGAGFGISAQTCTTAPVASMATCTVTVSYTPTAAGTATGTVVIASNDLVNPSRTVLVLANGTTAPMGSVSVTSVNYQNVTIGVNSTRTVTINNGGSGVLTVTGVTLSGANAAEFNAPNTCVTISAGASCNLTVTFKPTTPGNKTAMLTITTDDPAMRTIVINLAAQASKIEEVVVAVTNEGNGSFGGLDLLALALVVAVARRRRVMAMVTGAVLLATPAMAGELPADAYWYAGAGVGSSTGKASESAVRSGIEAIGVRVDSLNFDDSDSGWQAFVGYQATARFGVELGYVDLGEAGINIRLGAVNIDQLPLISRTISENVSFLGDGIRGSLTFRQPVGERASLHARVGLIAWEITSGIGGTAGADAVNLTEVESGSDVTFGFGGDVWFGQGKFGVRAEWERFKFGEQDAQMWSLNGLYRF